jgi:transcriptional regulator with XRE-family HTH domain
MSIAEGLVLARDRLGLTQAEAAGFLGTRQANVSAYERGRLQVGEGIRDRIESFSDLRAESSYAEGWPATLASSAAALRADILSKVSESDMLRLVIQAADDFARLTADEDRRFFLARPGATGSARWMRSLPHWPSIFAVEMASNGPLHGRGSRIDIWIRRGGWVLQVKWNPSGRLRSGIVRRPFERAV